MYSKKSTRLDPGSLYRLVDINNADNRIQFPVGPWPKDPKMKEIGTWQYWEELQLIDSYTHGLLSRVLGWGQTEVEVLKAKVKNDFKNPLIHVYLPVYFVWGRKP